MGKKLLIVESPAKAKTIGKYLGADFSVKASIGHVRDIPKSNKNAVDIEAGFIPHYEIIKGKEKVVGEIAAAAKNSDEVILATDLDREGEAIAWHIAEILLERKIRKPIKRAVYHEITKEAIMESLEKLRDIDQNLRRAQEARRILDRLVGYDLSGLIWKKVRYGLSAGRVQSPALRIIVEREREIRAFKPERYFTITAEVETRNKESLTLTCDEEPKDKEEVERIIVISKREPWSVRKIAETKVMRSPKPPFITSTLQQSASTRLDLSPSRTMQIAQRLYESGHITYMRTDSLNLSASALNQIAAVIRKKFGVEYHTPRSFRVKSKSAQEAHEAIRPSNLAVEKAGATPDQRNLYSLIWQRSLACQMAPAQVLRTKVTASVLDETVPSFSVKGSRILFEGWFKADPESRGEERELPKLNQGDTLTLKNVQAEEKQTEPPARFSEAGLIKELEKRDIGRPSTYATIVKTLQDRGYVTKENKALKPTDVGEVVSTFLEEHFGNYISDSFTAEMEDELDEIASGKRPYEKTLRDFYLPFQKDVQSKAGVAKLTTLGRAPEKYRCPKCGKAMVVKLGKTGKFLSCENFPACDGARTIDGESSAPTETNEVCPECKTGKLIIRHGRFGQFIACSNYPKCTYAKKNAAEEAQKKTGVSCPLCTRGELLERSGRYGPFFSCSNYPRCTYTIKARPTGNICRKCGSLMMEGTKTIPERCSNKDCPNHRPNTVKG